MGKSRDSDTRPYHHGDLRRAIVTAALEILSETQSVDFSLRELARRAGVSHNAPYKHFAEKSDLLAAVSAAGFELLTKRIAEQIARIGNPRAQLFVILRTYIRFGVENPALYRLMFGGYLSGPDSSRPAIERAAADKMREQLQRAITDGALGQPIAGARAQCAQDRRRYSHLLVAGARADLADGRWSRRPEREFGQIVREPGAGHHRWAEGKLSAAAARHMGRPAARHSSRGGVGKPPLPRDLVLHVAHASRKRKPDAPAGERTVFRQIVQDDGRGVLAVGRLDHRAPDTASTNRARFSRDQVGAVRLIDFGHHWQIDAFHAGTRNVEHRGATELPGARVDRAAYADPAEISVAGRSA